MYVKLEGGFMETMQEFAEFMKVHENTVRKWIDKGMPCIRQGNVVRIDRNEALVWLKDNQD
jgi:excisionase family DNA binding protein